VQRQSKKHKSGHCRTNAIINVLHLLDVPLVDWFQALYYLAVWFAWVGTVNSWEGQDQVQASFLNLDKNAERKLIEVIFALIT